MTHAFVDSAVALPVHLAAYAFSAKAGLMMPPMHQVWTVLGDAGFHLQ